MKMRSYLFLVLLTISFSLTAQINKTDVQAFFNEADVTSIDHILIVAEIRFDKKTQDYLTKKTWYTAKEITIKFNETSFSLKDNEDLIYIPYSSIRTLYKGMDDWSKEQAKKPIIKIDLIGNSNLRID